jgi:hypothetical protein
VKINVYLPKKESKVKSVHFHYKCLSEYPYIFLSILSVYFLFSFFTEFQTSRRTEIIQRNYICDLY